MVATQKLTEELGVGIFFNKFEELGELLRDKKELNIVREVVWKEREKFTFDYYVLDLVNFFYAVIKNKRSDLKS